MTEEGYQVKLTDVFQGPLDLLLHLIKKNEVNIYDIPVAEITKQYLQYLEWMKALNIDFAGEFIVMASTLTQVKSRMLLPAASDLDGEDEDPRMEIVRPLTEYLQMKSAAEALAQRTLLGEGTFTRTSGEVRQLFAQDDQLIQIGLFELIDAFQQILDKIAPEDRLDLTADRISVKDRISELVDMFEQKESLTFEELFSKHPNRTEVIVTFLAILEMVKLALIRLAQHSQTGVIRLFYQ